MGRLLDSFRVARFTFSLCPTEPIGLPHHAGSTLRGAFGHVFRRVGCASSALGGSECALGGRCPYHYIFETPVPPGSEIFVKTATAPRPFVIEPPLDGLPVYEPGNALAVGLVLIGRAIDYLPYFVLAFEELGRLGLGRGRGRYRLESVTAIPAVGPAKPIYHGVTRRLTSGIEMVAAQQTSPPPASGASVTITLVTPTLLHYGGRPSPPDEFHVLFRSVLRRVNFLNYFHCNGALLDDAGELIAAAEGVSTADTDLRWHAWERYSARQDQRVPMGGFTGSVTYHGDLAPFWPWLAVGEWIHVGKGATFGLGRYKIYTGSGGCDRSDDLSKGAMGMAGCERP